MSRSMPGGYRRTTTGAAFAFTPAFVTGWNSPFNCTPSAVWKASSTGAGGCAATGGADSEVNTTAAAKNTAGAANRRRMGVVLGGKRGADM